MTLSVPVSLPNLRKLTARDLDMAPDVLRMMCESHLPELRALALSLFVPKEAALAFLSSELAGRLERLAMLRHVLQWREHGVSACEKSVPFLRYSNVVEVLPAPAFHASLVHLNLWGRLQQQDVEVLSASDLPALKFLRVDLRPLEDVSPLGRLSLPSLESLNLISDQVGEGILAALAHSSLPALKLLKLAPWDTDKYITLEGLSTCKNLRSLEELIVISLRQTEENDRELARCTFPRLRHLDVSSSGDLSIMASWDFPSLRRLKTNGAFSLLHQGLHASHPWFPFRKLREIDFYGNFSFPMEEWLASSYLLKLTKVSCQAEMPDRLQALLTLSGLRELRVGLVTRKTIALGGAALQTLQRLCVRGAFVDVADWLSENLCHVPRLSIYCGALPFIRDPLPQPGLRELNVSDYVFGAEGMRLLCKCDLSQLRRLEARSSEIGVDALCELARVALPSLTYLDLSQNSLGAREMHELGHCTMPALEELDISERVWPTVERPVVAPKEGMLLALEGWCFPKLRRFVCFHLGLSSEDVAPLATRKFPHLVALFSYRVRAHEDFVDFH